MGATEGNPQAPDYRHPNGLSIMQHNFLRYSNERAAIVRQLYTIAPIEYKRYVLQSDLPTTIDE
jgi:hypothetical protein